MKPLSSGASAMDLASSGTPHAGEEVEAVADRRVVLDAPKRDHRRPAARRRLTPKRGRPRRVADPGPPRAVAARALDPAAVLPVTVDLVRIRRLGVLAEGDDRALAVRPDGRRQGGHGSPNDVAPRGLLGILVTGHDRQLMTVGRVK